MTTPKPTRHIASFHRTEWAEFKSLPPDLQAIKDKLLERIS